MTFKEKLAISLAVFVGVILIVNIDERIDVSSIAGEYRSGNDVIVLEGDGTYSQVVVADVDHGKERAGHGRWNFLPSGEARPSVDCANGDKIHMSNYLYYNYIEHEFRDPAVCASIEANMLGKYLIVGDVIYKKVR